MGRKTQTLPCCPARRLSLLVAALLTPLDGLQAGFQISSVAQKHQKQEQIQGVKNAVLRSLH